MTMYYTTTLSVWASEGSSECWWARARMVGKGLWAIERTLHGIKGCHAWMYRSVFFCQAGRRTDEAAPPPP